jgi:WD40 repeat protein
MFRSVRLVAIVLVLTISVPGVVLADGFRTWSDTTGQFKVKAKFVSMSGGKVTLEQEDGEKIEIELSKLSPADRKYAIEQRSAENPFRKKSESPFKPKSNEAGNASPEPSVTSVDWSASKIVDANPTTPGWRLATSGHAAGNLKPQIIRLPAKTNFFEKCKGLAMSPAAQRAVIGYGLGNPNEAGATRLAVVDLAGGKMLTTATTPGQFAPLALSDDGKRVLMRSDDFGHGKHDKLELWTIEDGAIRRTSRWIPYYDVRGADRDVHWAEFLADGRLATCSSAGRLAIWELEPLGPLYQLTVARGCTPALSPDRKQIAFATEKEVGVLDPANGSVLVAREFPTTHNPTLAFSPDGRRLACAGFDKLYVWDAGTGEQQREIQFQHVHVGGKLDWAGNEHVLVGGHTLLDLERQIRFWDYQGGEIGGSVAGLGVFVASEGDRGPGALIIAKIPHEAANARLAKAMAEPDFLVLKPGTTVAIDVSGLADADRRDNVASALRTKLEANGCRVADGGTITLKAATEVGKERDVTYHTFGMPFGNKTYKVREHISKLQFDYQGKPAWQSSSVNIPFFVRLKEGETMEQYLKAHEKPNYDWFDKVQLPKLLTKPTTGAPGLGTSRVTTAGLR